MKKSSNKKGVIITHVGPSSKLSYDILKHKSNKEKLTIDGYKINCTYVKGFIKENPDYVYLYSEDMSHIPEFNWIEDFVNELVIRGWERIHLDESDLK